MPAAAETLQKPLVLIAGPTACGKSRFALRLARQRGGVIVNADSMQIYGVLQLLTARPSLAEQEDIEHRLYGILAPDDVCSAARWADMAKAEIADIWRARKTPILVGGTGMYLRTLWEGIAYIPDIDPAVRSEVRALLEAKGPSAVKEVLASHDPESAQRLEDGDSQRLARALEVSLSTGRPLSYWQAQPLVGGLCEDPEISPQRLVVMDDRAAIYARCNQRFDEMLEQGALCEVRALREMNLSSDLPLMRAVGVPPLLAHLRGEMSLEDALELAKRDTRRYAKRQMTWIRNQFEKWDWAKSEDYINL